jgi:uncharacterized protein (DUF1697 family)
MSSRNSTKALATYVALLRGINVGGKHILPMKHLVELFAGSNCAEVRTYIQSGNVIFRTTPQCVQSLPALVADKVEQRFGFRAPVIVRSTREMSNVVRGNPFTQAGLPEKSLHVYFLADRPAVPAVKSLDPERSLPDTYHVVGREIYLNLPNGAGRSKLTNAYFDTKLSTLSTSRNWATVLKLFEMMQA